MDTQVSTQTFEDALRLCELGRYRLALEVAQGLSPGPHRAMIEGAAIALTEPGRAKDLLTIAVDGLSGDLRDKANISLASCYWSIGERAEARIIIGSVAPRSDDVSFILGVVRAAIDTGPAEALPILSGIAPLLDRIDNSLWKGKYFNQRGAALQLDGQLDHSIIAYTEAKFYFQQADIPELIAAATSNLAGALSEAGEFEEAHRVVDEAIAEFKRLGVNVYLAQAHDTKARIFLCQQKYVEASKSAPQSVTLLENREQKELLARSLITDAIALAETKQYLEAFRRLHRARQIGEYLASVGLLFDVAWEVRELAKKIKHYSESSLIEIALKEGSYRSAAKKMKIFHHAFIKLVKKHGLERTPKSPTLRILNPRKRLSLKK